MDFGTWVVYYYRSLWIPYASFNYHLINKFGTSIVQIPNVIKLQPTDDDLLYYRTLKMTLVMLLIFQTHAHFHSCMYASSTPSNPFVNIPKSLYSSLRMPLARQGSRSQCFLLHPFPSSLWLDIIDALNQSKSRITSKSYLAFMDFENIEICDVKYLSSFFNDDSNYLCYPYTTWSSKCVW